MARKPIFSADDGDVNDDFDGAARGYDDDSGFGAGAGGYCDSFYGAQADDDAALRPTRKRNATAITRSSPKINRTCKFWD